MVSCHFLFKYLLYDYDIYGSINWWFCYTVKPVLSGYGDQRPTSYSQTCLFLPLCWATCIQSNLSYLITEVRPTSYSQTCLIRLWWWEANLIQSNLSYLITMMRGQPVQSNLSYLATVLGHLHTVKPFLCQYDMVWYIKRNYCKNPKVR